LGTIAVQGAEAIERELAAARQLTNRPIAVNLILHFARPSWFRAADKADVVVTFWGRPKRRTSGVWFHQAGSVAEARSAHAAGADGVIVQGVEAGGHVRGQVPALELLAQVRAALGPDYPLFLAGGIAERGDVEVAMAAGAHAAVAGTRFLLSPESDAHPAYKERLLAADRTLLTELFGLAWPAPHRVVPNAATERQLTATGVAQCWGDNGQGQLGNSRFENPAAPVIAQNGMTFATIGASGAATCGTPTIGASVCWGLNVFGKLGIGSRQDLSTTPLPISGGRHFTSFAGGMQHYCALTADGQAWCWGLGRDGQLGAGPLLP
jgi:hypothetical protein